MATGRGYFRTFIRVILSCRATTKVRRNKNQVETNLELRPKANDRTFIRECKKHIQEIYPLAHFLFPPAKFSLRNSEISTTAAHSSCFDNFHRHMDTSIVLMAAIV